MIAKSDVLALLNHDVERGVLARCRMGEGSLTLEVDDNGLKYTFDAPMTALGDELLEGLKRGDIKESSFCFTVEEDKVESDAEGKVIRHLVKIAELFDVSPVYFPAYPDTSVAQRSIDKATLADYYEMLNNQIEE